MNVNTPQNPTWNSKISSAVKGVVHESIAAVWLLMQGYEVFQNVSPSGPVDLIATKGNEIIKVDVKTATGITNTSGKFYFSPKRPTTFQEKMGVRLLLVYNGVVIGWNDESGIKAKDNSIPDETIIAVYEASGFRSDIAERFGISPWMVSVIREKKTVQCRRVIPETAVKGIIQKNNKPRRAF